MDRECSLAALSNYPANIGSIGPSGLWVKMFHHFQKTFMLLRTLRISNVGFFIITNQATMPAGGSCSVRAFINASWCPGLIFKVKIVPYINDLRLALCRRYWHRVVSNYGNIVTQLAIPLGRFLIVKFFSPLRGSGKPTQGYTWWWMIRPNHR